MNQLICTTCRSNYPLDAPIWRCTCGGLLDLQFEPHLDVASLADRKPTLWRYREALPLLPGADVVSLDQGYTPLLEIEVAGRPVYVKQDQLFSTGSYKDRGAALLISHAKALGVRAVVEDSSGNAGCAIAAYCARAGIACTVYVPQSTSPAKLAQIEAYGATLCRVPGTRQDTADAVLAAAETTYYASHSWNPFFFHGTKSFAYEVVEQLGWTAPDMVVLPAGNGTLLLGAAIGFRELRALGLIERLPRLVAVQAGNCAPLYRAFHGLPPMAQPSATVAAGIAIPQPIRGPQILAAVRESGGTILAVSEAEIARAHAATCRQGFYIEPTSAATVAGLAQYVQTASLGDLPSARIVSVYTGHGLKAAGK
jgi:threonine synthase